MLTRHRSTPPTPRRPPPQPGTGWRPQVEFEAGLAATVDWYRKHEGWVERIKSGEYASYYARNYENRDVELRSLK